MLNLNLFYDIIMMLLILAGFILAITKKRNREPINDNVLVMLSRCDNIFWGSLSTNNFAIELLKKRFEYEKALSLLEYNNLHYNHKINWMSISANKGAIKLIKDRIAYEKSLGDKYEYQELKSGTCVLNKIHWGAMTTNINALELLRERIKYEKSLKLEEYNILKNRIDWTHSLGSDNSNAMILLKDLLIE